MPTGAHDYNTTLDKGRDMKRLSLAALLFLATCALGVGSAAAQSGGSGDDTYAMVSPNKGPRQPSPAARSMYAPGRLLVKFTPSASVALQSSNSLNKAAGPLGLPSIDALNQQMDLRRMVQSHADIATQALAQSIGMDRWYTLDIAGETDMESAAQRYRQDPSIEAATPDYYAYPAAVPNDPLYSSQWGHNNTGQMKDYCWGCGGHDAGTPVGTPGFDAKAQAAWDAPAGYGSASVVIAIIDSGVDAGHPDLRQVTGWDYGDNDSNPTDDSASPGHGTAVAGVVAGIAGNGIGVAGVAGGCSIMPLKVANSAGSMAFSSIQNALTYAANNGADIANMSLGAAISSDPATDDALLFAYNSGVTLLAATGNENNSTISYPAINSLVIGVGAASPCGERKRSSSNSADLNPGVTADPNSYTCDGERWWGSSYGTSVQDGAGSVDIIAPTILPTTDIQGAGGYDPSDYSMWFNGTSCATPYASGVAALIVSANPTWTPAQVRAQLVSTAVDVTSVESGSGWDRYTGYGMVDAAAAVGGGTPPPSQSYASIPYSNGFESGALDEFWTSASTNDGRVRVATSNGPRSGSYQLLLDDSTSGGFSQNDVDLHVDLSAESQVLLSFWWKEFGDETHSQDGVYFSDDGGGSFTKVQDLNGQSYTNQTWNQFTLDVDALAASSGLSLSSTFVVRFTQYDNYPMTSDGFGFDDVLVDVDGGTPPPTGDFAAIPYTTGFEGGALDQYWSSASTGNGRVRVATTNGPKSGSYQLLLDDSTSGGFSQNDVDLRLDLSSETQVDLDFWWKEFGDETHSQDGVYFSDDDGASFTKVQDLNGQSYTNQTWNQFSLDVDALASANGLALSNTFVVRFTQYDNYPMTSDGFGFDDISVTAGGGGGPTYITSETESNGSSATANGPVGTGVNVSGTLSSSSDDDWFYFDVATAGNVNVSLSIGGSADLDWFLYNSSLSEVARGYTTGNPEAGSASLAVGRYFLFVDGYQGATSSYTLSITGGLAKFTPGQPKAPLVFALHQNFPNPFNPSTTIAFDLPAPGKVNLTVYNLRGQLVRTLVNGPMTAGFQKVVWDGKDNGGSPAATGQYLFRIASEGRVFTKKMVLLK
jgi:subtilisin family serine protease